MPAVTAVAVWNSTHLVAIDGSIDALRFIDVHTGACSSTSCHGVHTHGTWCNVLSTILLTWNTRVRTDICFALETVQECVSPCALLMRLT